MEKKVSFIKLDRKMFIKRFEGFANFYTIQPKPIGRGAFGKVYRCVNKLTKDVRVIKVIRKYKVQNVTNFLNEVELLKKLDHPNIIRLFEYFEDSSCVYLIMENCSGGELFEKISAIGSFTELDALLLFKQMLNALSYCNRNGICHKDLKPENFLFSSAESGSVLKLIDFGLSQVYLSSSRGGAKMTSSVGTPYYKAPEVTRGKYDEKCDIWSLGVILYILICGVPPFYGSNDSIIQERVLKGKFEFDLPVWKSISRECMDLISRMLRPDEKRITCAQALEHKWLNSLTPEHGSVIIPEIFTKRLCVFRRLQKIKQAVLSYIACQLNEKEIEPLRRIFQALDKNGDGVLAIEEIMEKLSTLTSNKELSEIILSLDTNESGFIDYNEFLAAIIQENIFLKKEKILQAFSMFDTNKNGTIEAEELRAVVSSELNEVDEEEFQKMLNDMDKNKDGKVDLEEFFKMMYELKDVSDSMV